MSTIQIWSHCAWQRSLPRETNTGATKEIPALNQSWRGRYHLTSNWPYQGHQFLSRGPPTACHHCGQTPSIDHMSNSHYNRLTQIQSLLFCYLFTIQLELTKWTQTCVIQYKEIIEHAIWIKWSLISPKIKILLINLGVIFWNGMSGSVEGYYW